ncbi:hypothetical protein [Gynuella sunshinyii]|uniref:Uncharacterized protein n=1 Tax=Gynuella sunshinyii YC6258 TaxID=1445510 RepID=A0A0C5VPB3_9GAMM|nr:hypothetical protein [Gynuella sunshinyii]AJQ92099.1 hypothetical Protein YC6258_00043 [Gynuella sunshinyii YC6258]
MKVNADQLVRAIYIISAIIGLSVGWKLSFFQSFQPFKLVNLIGLIYDIVAVILLSYVVLVRDNIQHHIAHKLSMLVIIFSVVFPASLVGGSMLASFFGAEFQEGIRFAIYIFVAVSIIPVTWLFRSSAFEPVGNVSFTPEKRVKILGAMLLIMGFIFQLVAAFIDLISDA